MKNLSQGEGPDTMTTIVGLLKNSVKKVLGEKLSAYLHKTVLRLRPSLIKDMIVYFLLAILDA